MAEHLKYLFDRALDDEPGFPDDDVAQQAMARGKGIRRRRGLLAGGSVAAAVAVVAAATVFAVPAAPAVPPPPASPVALALMAQSEPECTWPAPGDATDVLMNLRRDSTGPQRDAIQDALRADPVVQNQRFVDKDQVLEELKQRWRDSPDFVAAIDDRSITDSFRVRLARPGQYSAFVATYAERPGVDSVYGGVCP